MGERIKQRREQLNLSVRELALHINVTKQTVHGWEKGGVVNLRPPNLIKLADKLRANIRWLVHGEGQMERIVARDALTPQEARLVLYYRDLSDRHRRAVFALAHSLSDDARGSGDAAA